MFFTGLSKKRRESCRPILLFLLLLGLGSSSFADVPTGVAALSPSAWRLKAVDILVDEAGSRSLEEIAGAHSEAFRPIQKADLNRGFQKGAVWLRLHIVNSGPAVELLVADGYGNDRMTLCTPEPLHGWLSQVAGWFYPQSAQATVSLNTVLKSTLPAGFDGSWYLRLESEGNMTLQIQVAEPLPYSSAAAFSLFAAAVLFGFGIIQTIINFFIAFSFRRLRYFFFAGYCLVGSIVVSYDTGLGSTVLWPNAPILNYLVGTLGLAGMVAASALFLVMEFKDMRRQHPWLFHFLVLLLAWAVVCVVAAILARHMLAYEMVQALFLFSPLIQLTVLIMAWRGGQPNARALTLAWTPGVLLSVLTFLDMFAIVPIELPPRALDISFTIQVLGMGAVLYRHIARMQQKITSLNEGLEEKIKERTQDLQVAHWALRESLIPVFIMDPEGTITEINQAFTRVYGYEEAEAVGRRASLLYPGAATYVEAGRSDFDARHPFDGLWAAMLNPELGRWEGPVLNRRRDGEILETQLVASAVYGGGSKLIAMVAWTVDLTKRMQAEQAVRIEVYRALSELAEKRDNETGYHLRRIGLMASRLATLGGFGKRFVADIEIFAPLHDIGKVAIHDAILLAPRRLEPEEMDIMRTHATVGYSILKDRSSLEMAADITLFHHERWDGKGYPRGLSGEGIPAAARIVAICDVYDALRSVRPYKKAWPHAEAMGLIRDEAGAQFDPDLARLFVGHEAEFEELFDSHPD